MTHTPHSRSRVMEIGRPSVENVTLGLRPRVTFSTSGSSYFHVPLTTVRHLLNVAFYWIGSYFVWHHEFMFSLRVNLCQECTLF